MKLNLWISFFALSFAFATSVSFAADYNCVTKLGSEVVKNVRVSESLEEPQVLATGDARKGESEVAVFDASGPSTEIRLSGQNIVLSSASFDRGSQSMKLSGSYRVYFIGLLERSELRFFEIECTSTPSTTHSGLGSREHVDYPLEIGINDWY